MEFDEKVQEVQKAFTAERIKRFAIASPELLKQSDYVKSLYMRMLCALMRCGSPTEEQVLFVQRLTAGAEMIDNFTELMRQSMNMDAESITAFLEALSPNDMKYYFVLDGCITCVLGTGNDRFAMLAECAELLGVTEIELRYLAQAAKAIALQSSAAFDEAKKYRMHTTENLDLMYYLKTFYTGVAVDSTQTLHIYSFDKSKIQLPCGEDITTPNILIENAKLAESEGWNCVRGCDSLTFRNCVFEYKNIHSQLSVYTVRKVSFFNCTFSNFEAPYCYMSCVDELYVEHCTFRNCSGVSRFQTYTSNYRHGTLKTVSLIGNTLYNCRASDNDTFQSALLFSAVEVDKKLIVKNNKLVGCTAERNNVIHTIWSMWDEKIEENNNELCGNLVLIR